MGRGLSELQKRILAESENNGIIWSEACDVLRELHRPKVKRRSHRREVPENREAIGVSASRALTRLCKRGLLVRIGDGRHLEEGQKLRSRYESVEWDTVYVRTDKYCDWIHWFSIWHDHNCSKRELAWSSGCCQGRIGRRYGLDFSDCRHYEHNHDYGHNWQHRNANG